MKIFVISDTHGHLEKVEEVWSRLTDVDLTIHLGDYQKDAKRLERILDTEVVSVRGNMDGSYSSGDFKILATEFGNLLLVHGHMHNVKLSPLSLVSFAQEQTCKAVLFGHTHKAFYEESNGIFLVNPGSLSYPRDGSDGSYAIINTAADRFDCSIVYYHGGNVPRRMPRPGEGRLRRMLNDSDRL